MRIARVIGSTIATIKNPRIEGTKLMLVQDTDESGKDLKSPPYAAIDLVDAGVGDLVLTCHGSAARQTHITKDTPTDAVINAVLDHLDVDGKRTFEKA
ncbi:MAG: ethanolamine utilization protein EutN [Chloroflexi bacterium]|nr:MAG: ethanolamine utilization protein EutN [Chloroflexota bacterium]MBL1197144.1 ethanolamine utilization protein EutN [Chloroflexota bacterium]NOH14439.1 EutN/CcmL family microcompartment protein [Chloroflexota bacterium]